MKMRSTARSMSLYLPTTWLPTMPTARRSLLRGSLVLVDEPAEDRPALELTDEPRAPGDQARQLSRGWQQFDSACALSA